MGESRILPGDLVEWADMLGERSRGVVDSIVGTIAFVRYGPWDDWMEAPLDRLRKVVPDRD